MLARDREFTVKPSASKGMRRTHPLRESIGSSTERALHPRIRRGSPTSPASGLPTRLGLLCPLCKELGLLGRSKQKSPRRAKGLSGLPLLILQQRQCTPIGTQGRCRAHARGRSHLPTYALAGAQQLPGTLLPTQLTARSREQGPWPLPPPRGAARTAARGTRPAPRLQAAPGSHGAPWR